jgi:hypothetical protein
VAPANSVYFGDRKGMDHAAKLMGYIYTSLVDKLPSGTLALSL